MLYKIKIIYIGIIMNGITLLDRRKKYYTICKIDYLSDELKVLIQKNLSSVCFGESKALTQRKTYEYKNTLKEFFKRYDDKPKKTKVGMIGEFLTHILLLEFFPNLKVVSPYFNLEERSIKKGFDLVLYSSISNEIWFTEVKSGNLYVANTANQMTSIFLNKGKNDLYKRLNENEYSLWDNAINGAKIVLDCNADQKEIVENLLLDISDEIVDDLGTSLDKNVILVSSLFNDFSTFVEEKHIKTFRNRLSRKRQFKKEYIFSIQKKTYEKVEEFLRSESI